MFFRTPPACIQTLGRSDVGNRSTSRTLWNSLAAGYVCRRYLGRPSQCRLGPRTSRHCAALQNLISLRCRTWSLWGTEDMSRTHRCPVTATTDFRAPDILDKWSRAVPRAITMANALTIATKGRGIPLRFLRLLQPQREFRCSEGLIVRPSVGPVGQCPNPTTPTARGWGSFSAWRALLTASDPQFCVFRGLTRYRLAAMP